MTKEDMVLYLANAALISSVDRKLSPLEAKAIESIRQEIGATKSDLHKALTAVAQGRHKITPVGRFSDRVRNLEDMIFVSLSDRELSESEKPEVLSFAKSIKITQDQLTGILSESKLRIKLERALIRCASCGKEIPSESRFCPQCGGKAQRS